MSISEHEWLEHADLGRVSRDIMDKVEIEKTGYVFGDPDSGVNPLTTVCRSCHGDESSHVQCGNSQWKRHLVEGRVAEKVWTYVSYLRTGSTCGW